MSIREKLERMMVAITFAEAGQHETALKVLDDQKQIRWKPYWKPYWKRTVVRKRSRYPKRAPRLH